MSTPTEALAKVGIVSIPTEAVAKVGIILTTSTYPASRESKFNLSPTSPGSNPFLITDALAFCLDS